MRVLALTKYTPLGASSRVRTYQFVTFLEDEGIEVETAPLLGDGYIQGLYGGRRTGLAATVRAYADRVKTLLQSSDYDLVWVEKELFPRLPGRIERLLLSGRPYVVDYDDALFHRYDLHSSRLVRLALGRKIDRVMQGAAVVTAGNEYLASRARLAGAPRVEVLPSVVDADRYESASPSRTDRPFTIGWIGSPTSQAQLEPIRSVLAEHVAAGDRVVLVGATDAALEGVDVERRPWSEDTEVDDVRSFDVGIMPLTDTPWRRGKCGYKLIQSMAASRPVVASPVGVNAEIVASSGAGLLATTEAEWRIALKRLRDDCTLRISMGKAGRRAVVERYSVQIVAPQLAEIFRRIIEDGAS